MFNCIRVIAVLILVYPYQVFASQPVEWGFGIKLGQSIDTLEVYKVKQKLPFGMNAVKPPISLKPFTFYGATTNSSGKVSGVVGMATFRSWNECENEHYQLEMKLTPKFGPPMNSKNQGDWVIVYSTTNSEIRLACQPLESGDIRSRLILLFTANSLMHETIKSHQETTERATERLKENQSLFNK